ncbi:MAG: diguanylate cyclase domain-containing protein [Solirubrobacteraceae bacterium]
MVSASAGTAALRADGGRRRRARSRAGRLAWVLVAVALAAAGIAGSALGAHAVAVANAARSRRALSVTAGQVAAGVELAIQRDRDLVTSTSAFIAQDPRLSEARLTAWLNANHTHSSYPEIGAVALVELVPASRLAAFERHAPSWVAPRYRTRVVPSGRRSFYCLTALGDAWGALNAQTPGWVDVCALPGTREVLLGARDNGASYELATPYGSQTLLAAATPVYGGATTPTTVAGRRRAFVGWLGETIVPSVVLSAALRNHPNTGLRVTYHRGGFDATFVAGRLPSRAASVTLALSPGWTARVDQVLAPSGVFGDGNALGVLLAGSAVSLLFAALLYALASGRARARRLVQEKTRELEYLAMHDALTGLPNRVVALDRAEQLLARGGRTGVPVSALYIDIDGFKQINDSLGHAAGDRVLIEVARRLVGAVRENDTAARLAGDEFLVLLDRQDLELAPKRVAERLLEALREPFDVAEQAGQPLTLTASIGLASAGRGTAEQLVANADAALYAAKQAGRDRCVSFASDSERAPRAA